MKGKLISEDAQRTLAVILNTGNEVAALLEVGIEGRFAGRTPPRLGTLENQLFSTNPSDEMIY